MPLRAPSILTVGHQGKELQIKAICKGWTGALRGPRF